jgi:hypothetical protein
MLREVFAEQAERLMLERFEADLTKHVREIKNRRLLDILDIEGDGTPKKH